MQKTVTFAISAPLSSPSAGNHPHHPSRCAAPPLTHKSHQAGRVDARAIAMTFDQALPAPTNETEERVYSLYPPIKPYFAGELAVSDLHVVYYELSGNPNGLPVLFIHGGPGGGTEPAHRRFFDPDVYKIVLLDQRGCGRSRPFASLEQNTTWDLVSDMERVREASKIQTWVMFGGSWGSTLALAYAQKHPERVVGMILRGVFISRQRELRWLYERDGAAMLYPEAFERYLHGLPPRLRDSPSLMDAYHDVLSAETESAERSVAANAWSFWEGTLSTFPVAGDPLDIADDRFNHDDGDNLAFSRIENHYFVHGCFFEEDGFLLSDRQMARIANIRTIIVQGRWDMVCPRKSAFDLARKFAPGMCSISVIDNAGHATFEPGIEQTLLKATCDFGRQFGSPGTRQATK